MTVTLWTAAEVAAATNGTAHGDFTADHVTFDSREVIGGELFVALTGETADGHDFAPQARQRGAAGALVSRPVEGPHVLVNNTTAALEALAAAARARTDAKIIGVTGSVGKTGVKTAIAAALERAAPGRVHQSVKSYNNHTGVPLSLARMHADAEFGVFEMGMNHAGELARLTAQVRPHVALVTAIAPAHLEFFPTGEAGIADAKGEIFAGLRPGGVAIVPHDTPHRERLRGHANDFAERIVTFGLSAEADVHPLRHTPTATGSEIVARVRDQELHFTLGMAGRHWVSNAMAVLAAVDAVDGDLGLAALALAELDGLPGRGARFAIPISGGRATLIDESYNANPASMAAALAVLGEHRPANAGRRLAILGEMRELGPDSDRHHADLAAVIGAAAVDHAILVGDAMRPLADALGEQATLVADAAAAEAALRVRLAPDDVALVKGSNAIGLGRLVERLRTRQEAAA